MSADKSLPFYVLTEAGVSRVSPAGVCQLLTPRRKLAGFADVNDALQFAVGKSWLGMRVELVGSLGRLLQSADSIERIAQKARTQVDAAGQGDALQAQIDTLTAPAADIAPSSEAQT